MSNRRVSLSDGSLRPTPRPQKCACSNVGLNADLVVNGVSKMLLAAEISLGRLHGDMPKQKLDLVQFTSGIAAQSGTSPPEVMRGKFINGCPLGAVLHDMPHNPFRYTISPSLSGPANAPEHTTFAQPRDASHESIALLTQSGTGTVRTCRALPIKSTIAQWSSLR